MSATDLAQQYQRKTDKQHILDNPDTYIGSIEKVDAPLWVFDEATQKMTLKTIHYIPGLYKLFDEGVVNCRDHVIRMLQSSAEDKKLVTYIETEIAEDGTITMCNDGNGIDVAKHPEYDVWIPEMIFGQLRTSTNYNKDEERIVGGKNGFGFKLVLIWSTYGRVETVDHVRGLKYVQEFNNNLEVIGKPTITKVKSQKPYTKVTFKPDYARFGIPEGLTADFIALLRKRVYDIAAVTDHSTKKIKVSYNDVAIPVKNFQQYIDLYIGAKDATKRVYESADERWEYAVALSETHEFQQVSFVNGICTYKGGKHVDYIMGQITRKVVDYIEKKKKVRVNPNSIKEQLILFLRCDIVNPAFDSQTKDYMNTPSNKFGSACSISDAFIEKVAKMGVMDLACSLTEAKENKMAARKTDGAKTKTIRGIANFIDANLSGGAQSHECILILCEGLSAMSGIVSGLSATDRNTIGIYPLKGKLLNVRGEQSKKIAENKEITDIKKILGLENGREYKTMVDVNQHLRYGKVLLMTDQDLDGSHIKGLCVNLFHSEWASLLKIPGFIAFMNTPILRAKKGQQTLSFYNDGEYEAWKQSLGGNTQGWVIKYFKGLGTSTAVEFKEYFAHKKIVDFVYDNTTSDDVIDKIFNKKRADDRKTWLENYDKHAYLNTSRPSVTYDEFINNEMIHFSTYDCARSIPNMVDGLKTSLRKILYCVFKRNLKSEIKVAQLSASVSENSAYHHGEASLNGAIVNMAQNYMGSNNINLLDPRGQFGTRLHPSGSDSASERYIFTQMEKITRTLFPEADDAILNYLDDDGTRVEPEFYVPIIPMALINGISGIGTGFSSSIPPYNPMDVTRYLRQKLNGDTEITVSFVPYYEGFRGKVEPLTNGEDGKATKYLLRGVYQKLSDDKIIITELPVGTATMPYITFLEELMDGTVDKAGKRAPPIIKDFVSTSTETHVHIAVTFPKGELEKLTATRDANGVDGVEKLLKLTTTVSTTNMHLFTADIKLRKYATVEEIIDEYYGVRVEYYAKRKAYLVDNLRQLLVKLSNRAKYILETLEGVVDLRKKTAQQVQELLSGRGYIVLEGDYKYLTKMPMDSVTQENVAQIMKEKGDAEKELETLLNTTIEQMWLHELGVFEVEYGKYAQNRRAIQNPEPKTSTNTTVQRKKLAAK